MGSSLWAPKSYQPMASAEDFGSNCSQKVARRVVFLHARVL
jgi:hypothetical protein